MNMKTNKGFTQTLSMIKQKYNNIFYAQNKRNRVNLVSGFTLLIAIVTTSMLLIVSFVVVNIALKQLVIADANKQSQYAFYAADAGTECAVYWDLGDSVSPFATSTVGGSITCNDQNITSGQEVDTIPSQSSRIGGGGAEFPNSIFQLNFTRGCAIVTVIKKDDGDTTVESRGYNTCDTDAPRRFERGVTLTY